MQIFSHASADPVSPKYIAGGEKQRLRPIQF
jgi:hypothetical protein